MNRSSVGSMGQSVSVELASAMRLRSSAPVRADHEVQRAVDMGARAALVRGTLTEVSLNSSRSSPQSAGSATKLRGSSTRRHSAAAGARIHPPPRAGSRSTDFSRRAWAGRAAAPGRRSRTVSFIVPSRRRTNTPCMQLARGLVSSQLAGEGFELLFVPRVEPLERHRLARRQ